MITKRQLAPFDVYLPKGMSGNGSPQHYYPATHLENESLIKRLDQIGVYYIEIGDRTS